MRILYIDIDSLRPDHLSCYGYPRPTSPTIDSLAQQGVRFTNYYCSDSPCVPSRAACFSGRPGIQNGVVTHENTPAGCNFRYGMAQRYGNAPTLAHFLADAGFHTVSFTSFADRHCAGWFTFGFREFHLVSLKGGNEDAPEVNAVVLPWLKEHARKDNWFVHLNYWDAHTLYTEPIQYMHQMAEYPAPAWPDPPAIMRHQSQTGMRTARTLWGNNPHDGFGISRVPTMPDAIGDRKDFEHLISGYDGAIRYCDEHLAQVLEELERQGVLDDTAIIVSADHGEAFGELGQYMEHGSASPATHQIPLIVCWPGLTEPFAGTARDDLLLNIDLAPSIADAISIRSPTGWPGQSFVSALRGGERSRARPHLVWTHGLHTRQRAVFDGWWLFIRTYDPGLYLYPPRMLFDLQSDPHQENNTYPAEQEVAADLERILLTWERENIAATGLPDPMRLAQTQGPKSDADFECFLTALDNSGRSTDATLLREQRRQLTTEYLRSD